MLRGVDLSMLPGDHDFVFDMAIQGRMRDKNHGDEYGKGAEAGGATTMRTLLGAFLWAPMLAAVQFCRPPHTPTTRERCVRVHLHGSREHSHASCLRRGAAPVMGSPAISLPVCVV
jgi:hypothetical protein